MVFVLLINGSVVVLWYFFLMLAVLSAGCSSSSGKSSGVQGDSQNSQESQQSRRVPPPQQQGDGSEGGGASGNELEEVGLKGGAGGALGGLPPGGGSNPPVLAPAHGSSPSSSILDEKWRALGLHIVNKTFESLYSSVGYKDSLIIFIKKILVDSNAIEKLSTINNVLGPLSQDFSLDPYDIQYSSEQKERFFRNFNEFDFSSIEKSIISYEGLDSSAFSDDFIGFIRSLNEKGLDLTEDGTDRSASEYCYLVCMTKDYMNQKNEIIHFIRINKNTQLKKAVVFSEEEKKEENRSSMEKRLDNIKFNEFKKNISLQILLENFGYNVISDLKKSVFDHYQVQIEKNFGYSSFSDLKTSMLKDHSVSIVGQSCDEFFSDLYLITFYSKEVGCPKLEISYAYYDLMKGLGYSRKTGDSFININFTDSYENKSFKKFIFENNYYLSSLLSDLPDEIKEEVSKMFPDIPKNNIYILFRFRLVFNPEADSQGKCIEIN